MSAGVSLLLAESIRAAAAAVIGLENDVPDQLP